MFWEDRRSWGGGMVFEPAEVEADDSSESLWAVVSVGLALDGLPFTVISARGSSGDVTVSQTRNP